jgi:hypothetical protein
MISSAAAVLATVVDWAALGKVVLYSFIIAVGATVAVSLAILGAIRFADMRKDERVIEAGAFAVLAAVMAAASVGAMVYGIVVMTQK